MQFIQILEIRTSKYEKIQSMDEEWRKATEGKRTLRRSLVCRDRNDKSRNLVLAFFLRRHRRPNLSRGAIVGRAHRLARRTGIREGNAR